MLGCGALNPPREKEAWAAPGGGGARPFIPWWEPSQGHSRISENEAQRTACPLSPPQPGPARSHGDPRVCVFPGRFHRYTDVATPGLLTHGWPPSLPPDRAVPSQEVCLVLPQQLLTSASSGRLWPCCPVQAAGPGASERISLVHICGQTLGALAGSEVGHSSQNQAVTRHPQDGRAFTWCGAAGSPEGRPAVVEPLPEPGLGMTAPWAVFLEPRCVQWPGSHSVFEKGASPVPPGAALMGSTGRAAGSLHRGVFFLCFNFLNLFLIEG